MLRIHRRDTGVAAAPPAARVRRKTWAPLQTPPARSAERAKQDALLQPWKMKRQSVTSVSGASRVEAVGPTMGNGEVESDAGFGGLDMSDSGFF